MKDRVVLQGLDRSRGTGWGLCSVKGFLGTKENHLSSETGNARRLNTSPDGGAEWESGTGYGKTTSFLPFIIYKKFSFRPFPPPRLLLIFIEKYT